MNWQKWRVDARVSILAFGMILLVMAWVAVITQEGRAWALRNVAARQELINYSRLVEAHTRSIIRGLDQVVMHLKSVYEDNPAAFDLRLQVARSPILQGLTVQAGVIDSTGYLAASTAAMGSQRVFLGDREHFRVFAAENAGPETPEGSKRTESLFISKPVLGRASGKWSIQLARRLNGPGGQFAGVVVVSLDPGYISSVYQQIDLGPDGAFTVLGRDGIVRARAQAQDRTVGQNFSDEDYFKTLWEKPEGYVVMRSPLMAGQWVAAFRRMDDYPLAAIVARSEESILALHARDRRLFLGAGLAATLLIVGGTLLLCWEAGRQQSTERRLRAREGELEAVRERLEQQNRDLGQFAEVLAHHLQEPVRQQYIFAQRLERLLGERAGGDVPELLGQLLSGATRQRSLLRDVQLYLALDQRPATLETCAAEEALAGALSRCADRIREAGAVVTHSPLPLVAISSRRLADLLHALVENGIVHSRPGASPQIHIAVTTGEGWAEFAVSDNGPGIPEEYHERVFRVFERLNPRPGVGGTGIGLALARKIVETVQGRIWITTSPNGGTRVCFRIPLASTPEGA